jgi:hypothetical protein
MSFNLLLILLISLQCVSSLKFKYPRESTIDRLGQNIGPDRSHYAIPAGTILYHGTTERFTLDGKGLFLTPDFSVALAHVRLIRQLDHQDQPVILKICTTKKELKLLPFSYSSAQNKAIYDRLGVDKAEYHFGRETEGSLKVLRVVCSKFITQQLDGWRSPWDEDEIALCKADDTTLECIDKTCGTPPIIMHGDHDFEFQQPGPGGAGVVDAEEQYNYVELSQVIVDGNDFNYVQIQAEGKPFINRICV